MSARARAAGLALAGILTGSLPLHAVDLRGPVVRPGHHLPAGEERPASERTLDLESLAASLRVDPEKETVSGSVDLTLRPLRAGLTEIALDARDLEVSRVAFVDGADRLPFERKDGRLLVRLSSPLPLDASRTLRVTYAARPRMGLYFFPAAARRSVQVWNYGEGGLHAGFLPIWADTNDRYGVSLELTVPRPLVAIANGRLEETRENADGTRTFRWAQRDPIPGYLIAVQVGDLERVPLESARADGRTIPLAVWAPPGSADAARRTFGETPKMLEYLAGLLKTPYPWEKYDQVCLREFSIGAMETNGAVGFQEVVLRREGDPPDDAPQYDEVWPTWHHRDTISHELAHHWFGNLVTCGSLGSIFLNESFASFLHTVWTGRANGADDLTYQRWRYLDRYLGYVRRTGVVRPLQFQRYTDPSAMYQQDTTYVKGALVLHLLRQVVGEADFWRSLSLYLKENAFGSVTPDDLRRAFEETTGRNLERFFADWITGGGHPALQASTRFSPERKQLDLTVAQVQSDLPFENDFAAPIDVELFFGGRSTVHRVDLSGWGTNVSLPAGEPARAVVLDKGGWLPAEISFPQSVDAWRLVLAEGDLSSRLRALRELATQHPGRRDAVEAISRTLADARAHWGLRQEAALCLTLTTGGTAAEALVRSAADPDRRVRRAVALALGSVAGTPSEGALRRLMDDEAEDVAAIASSSLGRLRAPLSRDVLVKYLEKPSRWADSRRLGALLGLAYLEDPTLAPVFRRHLEPAFDVRVRQTALVGWMNAAPHDPELPRTLRELCRDRNRQVREDALEALGSLHLAEDAAFLSSYAASEPDPSLARVARDAAAEIERFAKAPAAPGR